MRARHSEVAIPGSLRLLCVGELGGRDTHDPMPIELDPGEPRPLTSREIAKLLCAIISGVVACDPAVRNRVPDVLQLVRSPAGAHLIARQEVAIAAAAASAYRVSWEIVLLATVSGLRGWCDPTDIETAIAWTDANLADLFKVSNVRPTN